MNTGQLKKNKYSVTEFSIPDTNTRTNVNIQREVLTCMLISTSCCITTNSVSKTADTTLEAHCTISSGRFMPLVSWYQESWHMKKVYFTLWSIF